METMTPKLILVPTDFSAPAAHALRYAAALGARFGAHLLVVYADTFIPPVDFTISAAGAFDLPRERLIETAREQLQTFAETNIGASMPYDVSVAVANPADAIIAQARESGANLIVMGTHGRSGLRRLLFGSVTEAVMRVASVPVIAVHETTPEAALVNLIVGNRSTPEGRAAVDYAGVLANADNEGLVEVPEGADPIETAHRVGADLIALGISSERHHEERVVQHSDCAVLVVNSLTARALNARELATERRAERPPLASTIS
jgi:nucleotide-binding universal stress UspA family protein